nr:DUF1592 domain-containing protein [Allomuricauda sp.]
MKGKNLVLKAVVLSIILILIPFLPLKGNSYWLLDFFGKFHPLLVHLPIGALLCLFILEIIVPKPHMFNIRGAILKFIVITAIPSVLAGSLLASSGSYGSDVFALHKWFGVATAVLSIWLYVIHKKELQHKIGKFSVYHGTLFFNVLLLSIAGHYGGSLTHGSDYLTKSLPQEVRTFFGDDPYALKGLVAMNNSKVDKTLSTYNFDQDLKPVINKYCVQCHGPEEQKAGLRLDSINPDLVQGPDAATWRGMLDMINSGEMPPEEEEQLTDEERRMLVDWITASVQNAIKIKKSSQVAVIRRLTKKQYTNSLNELLNVSVDFGDVLPDDEKSEMGFSNNGHELQTSPLHIEYYKQIAREALDKAIVQEEKPKSTHYKIKFGKGIGEELPAAMIGGFQSAPISSDDFIVEILDENGMPIQPKDSIEEAYYTEVKKNIGIGMRGSHADRYEVVEDGVVLYSALPHKEVSPKSWQGPSPNLKLLIKDYFPMEGDFEYRVTASKGYQEHVKKEGLISLRRPFPAESLESTITIPARSFENHRNLVRKGKYMVSEDLTNRSYARISFVAPKTGYYQIDFTHPYVSQDGMPSVGLRLNQFRLQERLHLQKPEEGSDMVTPLTLAYLEEGKHNLEIGGRFFVGFGEVIITPFPDDHPMTVQLDNEEEESKKKYDLAAPIMRVFAGARTDDGIDYKNFDDFRNVINTDQPRQYIFKGRLEDLPIPVIDTLETEILANIMGMGVWNDYLVKDNRDSGPPLLVHELEFEAPYHPVWPPTSHTDIFFDSPDKADKEVYTAQVLTSFMEKAYRRPLEKGEVETYMEFWRAIKADYDRYEDGVKEVLVAILCSPNFIYLAEPEKGTSDDEREYFLASRLAYFLWDSPPDEELLALADRGRLHKKKELKKQVQRMLQDDKIWEMVRNFSKEWLRLDRHESMSTNVNEYEDYSRFVKRDMAEETYHFVHHVLECNMYLGNLIESDFAMLNQNLAEFYGIEGVKGNHFRPVALGPDSKRGGLLSQGSFLSGHSDGTQAHAIKRAVWLRSRILGDRPPDPPPNVPELDPETPGFEKLTLKEQLFLHRNKVSCMDCHAKIDPYGIVFENYNAVGLFQTMANNGNPIDSKAELPDGKVVDGIDEIKAYILNEKIDDFTRSLVKHLFSYAVGRDVTFVDEPEIESIVSAVREDGYRFQSVFEHIITSKSFIGDF